MNFEDELAKRARARARRTSSTNARTSPSPAILPTTTTIPSTPPIGATPTATPSSQCVSPLSAGVVPKELSYEDMLAGRDFGSPELGLGHDHDDHDDNVDNGDDKDDADIEANDNQHYQTHSLSHTNTNTNTVATNDEDDTWETGAFSPEKLSTSHSSSRLKEDGFFRVGSHPSMTETVDAPSKVLPPSPSSDSDSDDDDDHYDSLD